MNVLHIANLLHKQNHDLSKESFAILQYDGTVLQVIAHVM